MNRDKKYYVFNFESDAKDSFPKWIIDKWIKPCNYDGYYSDDELLSIEQKIFNEIKEEHIDIDLCDIYETITVSQYDNEKEAASHEGYIENFHKTYSIRKLLKNK